MAQPEPTITTSHSRFSTGAPPGNGTDGFVTSSVSTTPSSTAGTMPSGCGPVRVGARRGRGRAHTPLRCPSRVRSVSRAGRFFTTRNTAPPGNAARETGEHPEQGAWWCLQREEQQDEHRAVGREWCRGLERNHQDGDQHRVEYGQDQNYFGLQRYSIASLRVMLSPPGPGGRNDDTIRVHRRARPGFRAHRT